MAALTRDILRMVWFDMLGARRDRQAAAVEGKRNWSHTPGTMSVRREDQRGKLPVGGWKEALFGKAVLSETVDFLF